MNRLNKFWVAVATGSVLVWGCGGGDSASTDGAGQDAGAPQEVVESDADVLQRAVDQRGTPCDCVDQNLEAMAAFLETLNEGDAVSAQEINAQLAEMIFPCMRPTGDSRADQLYSKDMGVCPNFLELTDVMKQVKAQVQVRVQREAEKAASENPLKVSGAKDVLDKLKTTKN